MSAFALGNSSYTIVGKQRKDENSRRDNQVQIVMGDGSSTYPTGGLAVSGANLGCPTSIQFMEVIDQGQQGIQWIWNSTTLKLQAYVTGSHAHDMLLKNAAVSDGSTTRVNAGTNLLGANTGSDITVVGAGANGGVKTKSDVALTEASSSFVLPTHTITLRVTGW